MTFEQFGFNEQLFAQIKKAGFTEATQIQAETIPLVMQGKDVIGQSKTGSGKTCAFALPILEKVTRDGLQAIILTPTRELCYQVADTFVEFGDSSGIKVVSVFGGVSIEPQIKQLERANIAIATPGRMLDHMERGTIDLSQVRFVVLDEVDRMADMGFIDDVERIMSQMPKERQTLLFSATMNDDVTRLASRYLKDPTQITAEIHVDRSKLTQLYYDIMPREKFSLLVHFLNKHMNGLSLVFCSTRHEADVVARNLAALDMPVKAIHGGLTQAKRSKALDMLKAEHISILVATDVAARGLDIRNVNFVYNYDVPKTSSDYIHRIGRTARAGESGLAITLLSPKDHENFGRVLYDRSLDIKSDTVPQFEQVPFKRNDDRFGDRRYGGRDGGSRGGGRREGARGFPRSHDERAAENPHGHHDEGRHGRRSSGNSDSGRRYGGREGGRDGGRRDEHRASQRNHALGIGGGSRDVQRYSRR